MQIKIYGLILIGVFLGLLFITGLSQKKEKIQKKEIPLLTTGKPELCLLCHEEKIQEKAHSREILGCSSCHLGNPLAKTKKEAHKGIIKNPSDLRVIHKTCGQPNCHPSDIKKVRHSLMATNHGIIRRLLFIFGEEKILQKFPNLSVWDLYEKKDNELLGKSLALNYYKKLCGSCHLYLDKNQWKGFGFLSEKGGGCSACHLLGSSDDIKTKKIHPKLTKEISIEKCVKCHNRSGRIGFTYQGLYESPQGGIYHKLWIDGRELLKIEPDVHFKADLHCIDCHIREEIMGDEKFYTAIEKAIEISCETCHRGELLTKKGRTLPNILKKEGKIYLKGKLSKKEHLIKRPSQSCTNPLHRRLSCSACHSKYMPQCMGCHVKYDPRDTHMDKILAKETLGLWEEYESYRRINDPPLAIKENKIVPVAPG
ncbi:MAG: hypothetical protein ACK4UR_01690 [Caldimicrobium sp.]